MARSLTDTRPITSSSGWLRSGFVIVAVLVGARVAGLVVIVAVVGLGARVLDPLEQLAEVLGRLGLLLLAADVADQRAAFLRVGGRMLADEFGQRGVVGEQFFAGALDPVQARRGSLVHAAVLVEGGAQRGDFVLAQAAHHAAHVLKLAALAFVVGDAARLVDGIREIFRHRHALERVFRQLDERRAQFLQRGHFTLELRFTGAIVAVVVLFGDSVVHRLNAGFAFHGAYCSARGRAHRTDGLRARRQAHTRAARRCAPAGARGAGCAFAYLAMIAECA
ncbi:hypothetical protein PT2222_40177 [Paraburkholderia tropica]